MGPPSVWAVAWLRSATSSTSPKTPTSPIHTCRVGWVLAYGGPLTWPLHISLLLAKEYALTGTRIKAPRAVELGLANHVAVDPVAEAIACAKKILELPQQAAASPKR